MSELIQSGERSRTDREAIQHSIATINAGLARSLKSTWLEIGILLAAIALDLFSIRTADHLGTTLGVGASILLVVASRANNLVRYRQIRRTVSKQIEITARQRVQADKLYGLSILDPLTELHNRRFGELRLQEEIVRCQSGGNSLAVLLFDLDYFKEINDKFGHAAGDLALMEFAARLRRAIRACDVPVRMGGDEFLVILPECPRDQVDSIVYRINKPVVKLNGEKIPICYSAGRAHYQYNDTAAAILGRADAVLY